MEDESFINELQSGDSGAFRKLLKLYRSLVYNTCLGMLQHAEDAEDMTQEVFIEVYRSVKNFRMESKMSTWLYRVATNKCLDHLRSKQRGKRSGETVRIDGEVNVQIPAGHNFSHPGVALEQKERAKILFAAISCLPENQKVAFTLAKVEGLSYQEICEVMQMKLPAVESLVHRAKQNLKNLLKNYYQSEK
ncbi:MAG TPA: RNA polymerase sigma factor [Bacteroidia bacterium]|nr:RNA polymerase sigma factor [Bacteroidia bacterium]